MNEAQLFEKVGRLQAALEESQAAYNQLLRFTSEIVSGECDVSRVLINLTDNTYSWSEKGTRPPLPMQINGAPVLVTAPDDLPVVKVKLYQMPPAGGPYEPVTVAGQFAIIPGHEDGP